jgi:pimeloyl-ACP methyl ester carboxylesterase
MSRDSVSAPALRRVASGEVTLAVREHSPAGAGKPTVVLVHGYPDEQDTWNTLVARLPLPDWHVVTYDVRGAGESDAPREQASYRTDRLVDDLVAVLDEVLPEGERVHLVGHDWGSCQLWDAVAVEASDPRLAGRIASFTSISGPSLDHMAWLMRHPDGREEALRKQRRHSAYIGFFCTPVLPVLGWRFGHRLLAHRITAQEGLPRDHFGPRLARNAVNGLSIYRANVVQRMRRPRPLHTDVPVLAVRPLRDPYLTELSVDSLDEHCSDVRVEEIDAGHWAIVTRAARLAELITQHVNAHR